MDKVKATEVRNPKRKPPEQENLVEHVVRTGLPPGVEPEDVKDPGKASPKGPADNRS